LVVLAVMTGVLIALWYPAFPGLVPDVVREEHHLQPANAYISVGSNAGLIVGNAVGGLLVATVGAGYALAIDALTFLVAGLLVISFRQVSKPHVSGESMLGDLAHGWRLVISIRWFVVVVLAFSVIVMALRGAEEVMGPVLALQEYGGAAGWAVVMGLMSVGLLVGAVTASRIHVGRPMLFGMLVTLTLPVWLVCLAFALPLPVVALGAFLWGMAIEMFQVNWFTTLQTHIPRESIARVSSYDAMGSLLLGPIGLALAGPLVAAVGLQTAFLIAAAICLVAILTAVALPSIRQLRTLQPQE
jgi:MFS family permease